MAEEKITVVIPALNEEKTISGVINGVKKYVDEVILVDDASTDETANIARRDGAIVVTHSQNQGYDRSINDGFALAAKRGGVIILTFDADGQHNPMDIPRIVGPILNGEADVVVGKRPRHARITEYLFAFIAKIKANIEDPLCGLKAYHIGVYRDIGYFDRISSIGTQLMFNAKKKGYRVFQKDVVLLNRKKDISRFGEGIKANWKIFKAIVSTVLK
jgi:glycosyltransferase involved in cell wall biosynthesis